MESARQVEVLVIGAGFAGVCAAIKLAESGITDFELHDKATGIGGTWWANTYPGATCDIPSHFYCYSFEPNPDWSRLYAPQPEIQAYIERCVDTYGVRGHIHLRSKVTDLVFDEDAARWTVGFDNGETILARFVINAAGALHQPMIPRFDGADRFSGRQFHSAEWDARFDPCGKRVAVIGSAASAIQIVPEIAASAARVCLFQRTANYIARRRNFAYSERQKQRFRRFPALMRLVRWKMFLERDIGLFPIITNGSYRDRIASYLKRRMRRKVLDPQYHEALEPDYALGCKRILISDDFFDALNRDTVELVCEPIERFTQNGIVTADGRGRAFDAVIYATGFDIEAHQRAIDVTGLDGVSIEAAWRSGAEAYRGVMIPHFPNYFLATGPNTGVGTTSIIFMIEQSVAWIVKCIGRARAGETISVTPEATADHNRRIAAALSRTVWASGCTSWYRRADGRIDTLYPWRAQVFRRQLRDIDLRHIRFGKSAAESPRDGLEVPVRDRRNDHRTVKSI